MSKVYLLFIVDKKNEQIGGIFSEKPSHNDIKAAIARMQLSIDEIREECDQFYIKEFDLYKDIKQIRKDSLKPFFDAEVYADGFEPELARISDEEFDN